jgi:hypothetical protein
MLEDRPVPRNSRLYARNVRPTERIGAVFDGSNTPEDQNDHESFEFRSESNRARRGMAGAMVSSTLLALVRAA